MVTESPTDPGILVADDDDLVRLVLRRVLEREGYRITDAASVPDAITACESRSIVLAIVDGHMPGGDLSATVDGIRGIRPNLPILIVSGDPVPPSQSRSALTGFLSKPVEIDALTAAVSALLGDRP